MKKKSGQNDDFNPFKSAPKAERANITARANNTAPMVVPTPNCSSNSAKTFRECLLCEKLNTTSFVFSHTLLKKSLSHNTIFYFQYFV